MDLSRLADHSFLQGLSEDDLAAVADVASEREFAEGEVLMSQGDFGHCLFLIEAGSADVSIDGDAVRSITAGDVVGEKAVVASGRRTASVVASSPVRALVLFKRDVWALERRSPEAAARLRAAIEAHV